MRAAHRSSCRRPSRAGNGRRIAVLGDMLELGDKGAAMHAELAGDAVANHMDLVFAAGPVMRHLFEALPGHLQGAWRDRASDLAAVVVAAVQGGDMVIVKGSNASRMSAIVDALKENATAENSAQSVKDREMLTWLSDFSSIFWPLNLFRYITFRTGGATATALFFVFFFGPSIIAALRLKQGKGQPIRDDGPPSHLLTKSGTPTMGGLMILSGLIVSTLLWANLRNHYVWIVLLVTAGFGAIGFYDDLSEGDETDAKRFFRPPAAGLEVVIAIIACFAMMKLGTAHTTGLALPFDQWFRRRSRLCIPAFGPFVIVSAGNAVNLTDGLDGLAIVPVMIAAAAFGIIAYLAGNAIFSTYLGINFVPVAGELAVVCGALIGAGLGFLWFNAPPAQIFMGDTGSLALGGAAWHDSGRGQARDRACHRRRSVRYRNRCRSSCRSFRLSSPASGCSRWRPSITISSSLAGPSRNRGAFLDHRFRARDDRSRHLEIEVTMTPVTSLNGRAPPCLDSAARV